MPQKVVTRLVTEETPNRRNRRTKDEAWKKVGPKPGEAKTKEKDRKKFYLPRITGTLCPLLIMYCLL
jgi:hypothetical protein